jgi:hypothetical protein
MVKNGIDNERPIQEITLPIEVTQYPVAPPPQRTTGRIVIWPEFQFEERYGRYSYAAITSAILAIFLVYGLFFLPIHIIYPDISYRVYNIAYLLMFTGWALGFATMILGAMANKRREKLGRLSIKLGLVVVCAPAILTIVIFIAWMFTWPP